MNFSLNLAEVDWQEPIYWPRWVSSGAVILTIILVLLIGYLLVIQGKQSQLQQLEQTEVRLKNTFQERQARAANADEYQLQMAEMRINLDTMLAQLPKKNEVAGLLTDISETGLSNGLEFELFKPSKEKPTGFYAELPITMKVMGDYHQIGYFVSDIGMLPRIVTLHDFVIQKQGGSDNAMMMELTAKTYRYVGEE